MARLLRTADQTHHHTPGGNTTTPLAAPATGAERVLVVRQTQQPGGENPLHRKSTEALVVLLDGLVAISGPTGRIDLEAGDAALVAAGELHQIRTSGDREATWLVVTPADVAFTREDGAPVEPIWAG